MELTFRDLIKNPSGTGTGHVAARYAIIADLEKRFKELIRDNKFRIKVYKTELDRLLFHIQVPSETLKNYKFWFDVLIEVDNAGKKGVMSSPIRIFSNNPAFVFLGYAYIANREEILIDWLIKKYDKAALKESPKIRNPKEDLGFEKSLFFACSYILYTEAYLPTRITPEKINKKQILEIIDSFEEIMHKYESAQKKERELKKKEKAELKSKININNSAPKKTTRVVKKTSQKSVSKVDKVGRVSSTKKSKKK